ncbi:unnamed protein product [Paramecium pentaurelia]|uniref:Transmembrane protein n=1 Tax=Paramecium pentaurelia TaxID=43138 RepID=A0A8S1VNJ8_9CILI|nr:unnamed protein product [Paramecium pentaurelia]
MKVNICYFIITLCYATEWIKDIETQRLYLCDRVVGFYYDSNKDQIFGYFSEYEESSKQDLVLNHFFYMMNNCMQELRIRYPDSTIDESLVQSIDWLQMIKPEQFIFDQRDLGQLSLDEIEIKGRMYVEKQHILENYERNQNSFSKFLRSYNLTEKSISIYAIVIIMSIFFYNFIKAMKFIIQEHIKEEEQRKNKKKKKIN